MDRNSRAQKLLHRAYQSVFGRMRWLEELGKRGLSPDLVLSESRPMAVASGAMKLEPMEARLLLTITPTVHHGSAYQNPPW